MHTIMKNTNKSFKTGIKAFDYYFGQHARGGDSWLMFGQSGGGKTNLACQTAGFTAADGKMVLYITTQNKPIMILQRTYCAVQSIPYANFKMLVSQGDDQVRDAFSEWVTTLGSNFVIFDWESINGMCYEEKYKHILDLYYTKHGRIPDLTVLDQIQDVLPQQFDDHIQKRDAFNMVATVVATKAVELDNVAIVVAMANSKCTGKADLNEKDTADSRTLCDSMTGVIGITSRVENDYRKATVYSNDQYLVVCKSREGNQRIMVKRQFDMCRFVGAY